MSSWENIRERVTGKWQIPLLVCSVALLVGSFLFTRPTPATTPIDPALKYLDACVAGGLFERAAEYGEAFLASEGRTPRDLAHVHLRVARAKFGQFLAKRTATPDAGDQVLAHYDPARAFRVKLTPEDFERIGTAQEWLYRFNAAVESYEEAIARGVKNGQDLRKHTLELRRDRLHVPVEAFSLLLDQFLAEIDDHRLDLRLWAIEEKITALDQAGDITQASTVLAREKERFADSAFRDRFGGLEALVMYKSGHLDEAERYLRTIRNRVRPEDEAHAMTGWLLGKVVLGSEDPQRPLEALSFFTDVIGEHPESPYALASRVGSAEALAALRRHEESLEAYRQAIGDLQYVGNSGVVTRDAVRASLGVLAEVQRIEGEYGSGAEYARLASTLVDRSEVEQATQAFGRLAALLALEAEARFTEAGSLDDGDQAGRAPLLADARARSAEAAAVYLDIARINTLNERRVSEASWRAAELYDRAGDRKRAASLYQQFARERTGDPLVPRALYRLGRIRQELGDYSGAVAALRECSTRFDHLIDGAKALIPLAECYLAMGDPGYDLAEKTLGLVLDDPVVFTPQAPEFADALLLLGDLDNRTGRYEHAISLFEEWLQRYGERPVDARQAMQVRYLLADSYRQSALALQRELGEAAFTGQRAQMQADAAARLTRARGLYRSLITGYQRPGDLPLTPVDRLRLKHARLYEADCLFAMQAYKPALKLYEAAAGAYQDSPTALAAYVQIINCHVFLGQPTEARAALARAEILTDRIPDAAFDQSLSPERRADWKRYFKWLLGVGLF
jgi:tetratricopeptide (TPR) repeat protein